MVIGVALTVLFGGRLAAAPMGTALTYQGQLQQTSPGGGIGQQPSSGPVTGVYDFQFSLWDAVTNGDLVGTTQTVSTVSVSNGLFTVTLDFGTNAFNGDARWLEIGVRTNGVGTFSELAPRQEVPLMPYALYAAEAGNVTATNFIGNGSGLTALNPTNLSAGTAAISISGNAATATTATTANNFSGPLLGDVTGTQDATVVSFVNGQTAAHVASGAVAANAATDANTANAIVKRDASGNFSGSTITATSFNGNGFGLTNLNATNVVGTLTNNTTGNATTASGGWPTTWAPSSITAGNLPSTVTNTAPIATSQLPGGVLTNNETGVTVSGTFTNGAYYGNGGGLTNLNATNVVGTLTNNTTGNATTASGGWPTTWAPSSITAGNLPSTVTNTAPIATSQLPGGVLTNNETGVTVSGTFTNGAYYGNGGGLTNLPAATTAPLGMALIPAGSFTMGDTLDGESDATPTTNITVSAFYMDVNLVTYSQWQSVYFWATNNGYGFVNVGAGKAANHPVQTVDWYDSVKWSNARSQQAGLTPVYYTDAGLTQVYTNGEVTPYVNWTANGYRLPTEAEWEKAARGGLSGQRFPWGNVITENLANYLGDTNDFSYDLGPNGYNSIGLIGGIPYMYTSPVGSFAANGYGLYDMAGNVYAWCWDWYGTPYGQPTTNNPTGLASGSYRVLRGGGWVYYASGARCADRNNFQSPSYTYNYTGFRCVRGR